MAIGLIACCIGVASLLFKAKMSKDPHKDLNGATYVSAGATMALGLLVAYLMFRTADSTIMRNALGFSCGFVSPWIAAAIGIAAGVIVGAFAERYTSAEYRPTQFLAKASLEGPALTITQGMALGMKSCMAPCIVLAAGIIVSYKVRKSAPRRQGSTALSRRRPAVTAADNARWGSRPAWPESARRWHWSAAGSEYGR